MCFLTLYIDSSIDPSRLIAFLGFSLLRCASNFYFVLDLFSFFLHNYTHIIILLPGTILYT